MVARTGLGAYIVSTSLSKGLVRMKARLVKIGNSRGVRIAKPVLEEAGLTDEVEIRVRAGAVVITPLTRPRAGWAEAAARLAQTKEARLLDEPTPTWFDEEEWEWD